MIPIKTILKPVPTWEMRKARFRVRFPTLTDADLNFEENRKLAMLKKLQDKLGKTTKELQVIIETL